MPRLGGGGWQKPCLKPREGFHPTVSGSWPTEEQRLFLQILDAGEGPIPVQPSPPATEVPG